ncbi:urotensin-2B isoform X2 [Ochotona princeps]|uniref:urotensin-2B isoform X2 n=1 Tax=Ochotona princeps TaxID=9978 RepID=UPI00271558E9|nr:urotensin-2B isoform X2 [Ochotona princeps]
MNMSKMFLAPLCFGLITFLYVMILFKSVHGWPYLTQEKDLFPAKEDTTSKELLQTLLSKNFDFQRNSNIDIDLASKLEKLIQLEKLKEQSVEAKNTKMPYDVDGLSSSHPYKRAPCVWPGKAVEDSQKPWDPAPAWETWRKFLAPGFGSAQHRQLWSPGE